MDVVFTGLVAARTPPESLNPTHPPPIPPCRSSIPSRDPGPSSTSTTREVPNPILPPLPSLALQRRGVHFTSVQGDIKSNISEPYHCQHPSFPPSLPSIPKDPWTNVVHAPSIQNNSLSLSARRAREMYTHQQKPLSLPIHPSIHPYDTLISSHTLICILSKKSNPILQFQHLPKLSSQTCTSLLYCSSAFLTISQTPLRLPPNKHRHIS